MTTTSQYVVNDALTAARLCSYNTNITGIYFDPNQNGVGATLTAATTGALTIDTKQVVINDRVLLTSQTNHNENGIYVVLNDGVTGYWQLQRASDWQIASQTMFGQFIPIFDGSANAGETFVALNGIGNANAGFGNVIWSKGAAATSLGTAATKAASNNSDANVASVNLPVSANHLAGFADTSGTIADYGPIGAAAAKGVSDNTQNTVSSVLDPVANPITLGGLATFADTNGSVCFKTTNFTAKKYSYAGGAASFTITDANIVATSVVMAAFQSETNSSRINTVTPGAGTLTITANVDPGASVVSYVAFVIQ